MTRHLPRRAPLGLVTLLALAFGLPASGCIWYVVQDEVDFPYLVSGDAYCTLDNWWELVVDVEHPQGSRAIDFAWVEVTEVWYAPVATVYTDLGSIDLDFVGGTTWFIDVRSNPNFLDCSWPWEYELTFVAQDREGQQDRLTIVR